MNRQRPSHPSLEFDRKQAKALLDAARSGDDLAIERIRAAHPRHERSHTRQISKQVALHDCQLVIAREYGFASWPRWKQFVETRRLDVAQRAAELVKAACSNDVRRARLLLEAEPQLARHDLYTACACGDADAVEYFLARDPASAGAKGGPLNHEPILYACFSRFLRADPVRRDGIVRSIRSLLAHGADPNAHFWMDWGGERWLQSTLYGAAGIANSAELTTLLLDSGARIDPRDNEVLYHATEFPDTTCLRLLLQRASPPAEQITYCLGRALDFEYPSHVALSLEAGADPNAASNQPYLHKAVYRRSADIMRMLLDAGGNANSVDAHGVSALRAAVRHGNPEIAQLLRARGARGDEVTDADARQSDPISLCLAAARDDVATIDRLLDAGADANAVSGADRTPPLHWATWRGRFNATRALVERGADIHFISTYGADALGTAIHGSANCFDTEGGPGMRLHDEAVAGDYPQIVEYLIARGARLADRIHGGSEAVQELLRKHGVPDAD